MLESVQGRIVKIIQEIRSNPNDRRLKLLCVYSLEKRRTRERGSVHVRIVKRLTTSIQMFKITDV